MILFASQVHTFEMKWSTFTFGHHIIRQTLLVAFHEGVAFVRTTVTIGWRQHR